MYLWTLTITTTSGNKYYCKMCARSKQEAISKILQLTTIEVFQQHTEYQKNGIMLIVKHIETIS